MNPFDQHTLSIQSEEQLLVDGLPTHEPSTTAAEAATQVDRFASLPPSPHSDDDAALAAPHNPAPTSPSAKAADSAPGTKKAFADDDVWFAMTQDTAPPPVQTVHVPSPKHLAPVPPPPADDADIRTQTQSPQHGAAFEHGDERFKSIVPVAADSPSAAPVRLEQLLVPATPPDQLDGDDDDDGDDHGGHAARGRFVHAVKRARVDESIEKTLDVNTPQRPVVVAAAPVVVEAAPVVVPIVVDDHAVDENAPTLAMDDAPLSLSESAEDVFPDDSAARRRAFAAELEAAALDDAPIAPPPRADSLQLPATAATLPSQPMSNWSIRATAGEATQQPIYSPVATQHPTQEDVVIPGSAPRVHASQAEAHAITASDVGSRDEEHLRFVAAAPRRPARSLQDAAASCDDGEPLTQVSSPLKAALPTKRARATPSTADESFKRPALPAKRKAVPEPAPPSSPPDEFVAQPPPPPRPQEPEAPPEPAPEPAPEPVPEPPKRARRLKRKTATPPPSPPEAQQAPEPVPEKRARRLKRKATPPPSPPEVERAPEAAPEPVAEPVVEQPKRARRQARQKTPPPPPLEPLDTSPHQSSPPPTLSAAASVPEAAGEVDLSDRFAAPKSVKKARLEKVAALCKSSRASERAVVSGKLFKDVRFVVTGMSEPVGETVAAVVAAGGGSLIDSVTSSVPVVTRVLPKRGADHGDFPNTLVIAPRALRTGKFIWALAAHVPCLHYNWVLHSAAAGSLLALDDYLLPATADGRPSPLKRVEALSRNASLDGLRVEVHSSAGEFRRTWEAVVRTAGGRVVDRLLSGGAADPRVDVIVTDPQPTQLVLDSAKRHKVPLVGVDWVIDTLILGEPAAFDAHDWRKS